VCDGFAADGYDAIAPALFDRVEPGVELGYDEAGMTRGRAIRADIAWDDAVRDVGAALAAVSGEGKAGVVGYCWGGSLAWLAATRLKPACTVCYYGGQIIQFKDEAAVCPVLLHFGDKDASIPLDDVAQIGAAQATVPVHIYPAGHGFNCDARGSFHAESAKLARERTLAFLAEHLG
jgi:carboxymethylenebutenolidase